MEVEIGNNYIKLASNKKKEMRVLELIDREGVSGIKSSIGEKIYNVTLFFGENCSGKEEGEKKTLEPIVKIREQNMRWTKKRIEKFLWVKKLLEESFDSISTYDEESLELVNFEYMAEDLASEIIEKLWEMDQKWGQKIKSEGD